MIACPVRKFTMAFFINFFIRLNFYWLLRLLKHVYRNDNLLRTTTDNNIEKVHKILNKHPNETYKTLVEKLEVSKCFYTIIWTNLRSAFTFSDLKYSISTASRKPNFLDKNIVTGKKMWWLALIKRQSSIDCVEIIRRIHTE